MEDWFLGIDLGTGSCKSVVVDAQSRVLGFAESGYAASGADQKWNEQDPEAVFAGMLRSARTAVERAGATAPNCRGLSLGSALHSLMAVDRSGRPLTGVITWADGRGAPQAQSARQTPKAAELYRQTGCPVHGMYPLYKILWLRQEMPAVFERAARFISVKEYVLQKLTGQYAVDFSVASGSGLLNIHTLDWNPASLDLAGIQRDQLTRPASPSTVLGGLEPRIAAWIGTSPRTPVVLGSSDAANSNLGAGAVNPWQATCMVGTSGAFRILSPQPVLDDKARTWCYAMDETHWLVGGAINNGGIAFSWLKDALNQANSQLGIEKQLSFEELIALAGQVGPGADGVICLPFFAGERSPHWNLNARAAFFGLTLQHDLRHLARALLEGVAFRLRSLSEILCEISSDIQEIRVSGGFTHSTLWPQITASVLDRDLLLPTWGETSALGAAFWAMLSAGALPSLDRVCERVPLERKYSPAAQDAEIYNQLYPIYAGLYEPLRDSFDQIARFQAEKR